MLDHELLMMEALDGTITPANQAQLDAYLNTHPEARMLFDAMVDVDNTLVATPVVVPAAHFAHQVMHTVAQTKIARPLKAQHVALIVGTNTIAVFVFWLVAAAVVGGLIANLAPGSMVEAARAVGSVLYGVFSALGKIGRVVLSQPITWVVMMLCLTIVVAWFGMLAKLMSPRRQLAQA